MWVWIASALLMGAAFGQSPVFLQFDLDELCRKATAADDAERDQIKNHRSEEVTRALQSEEALWKFLIDPSTSYWDRMAAAYQGASIVSPEKLVRLWKARAEFDALPHGVNPSPCEFTNNASASFRPGVWYERKQRPILGTVSPTSESRSLLGFTIHLPGTAMDYPLDLESRNAMPWVWQVWKALSSLDGTAGMYCTYTQPDQYEARAEAALRWHPANLAERRIRASVLFFGPRNAAWLRAQIRLALEENELDPLPRQGAYNPPFAALVHVAEIVIVQQTKNSRTAMATANDLARRAEHTFDGKKTPPTKTSVLAVARWALDQDLPAQVRLDFLTPLLALKGNPQEKFESLATFEEWFAKQRPHLEEEAAAELSQLNELAAELHQRIEFVQSRIPRPRGR